MEQNLSKHTAMRRSKIEIFYSQNNFPSHKNYVLYTGLYFFNMAELSRISLFVAIRDGYL